MSKRARHQPGLYASFLIVASIISTDPSKSPLLLVFMRLSAKSPYEIKEATSNISFSGRIILQLKTRGSRLNTFARRPHCRLREKMSRSCSHRRMQRKTCSSIWEGSESDPGLQRDHCHAARCDASAWGTQDWPGILIRAHGQHAVFLERNTLLKSKFSWSEFFAL